MVNWDVKYVAREGCPRSLQCQLTSVSSYTADHGPLAWSSTHPPWGLHTFLLSPQTPTLPFCPRFQLPTCFLFHIENKPSDESSPLLPAAHLHKCPWAPPSPPVLWVTAPWGTRLHSLMPPPSLFQIRLFPLAYQHTITFPPIKTNWQTHKSWSSRPPHGSAHLNLPTLTPL